MFSAGQICRHGNIHQFGVGQVKIIHDPGVLGFRFARQARVVMLLVSKRMQMLQPGGARALAVALALAIQEDPMLSTSPH